MSADVMHITKCHNLQCPNQAHEGQMAVLTTDEPVVSGHRGITLVLCSPCATVLKELMK